MNVLLLIILIHRLIYLSWHKKLQTGDLSARWLVLQRALEERDFSFQWIAQAQHAGEQFLDHTVRRQLEAGRLNPQLLKDARELWEAARRSERSLEKYFLLLLLHGALCLTVSCLVHLLLSRKLWMHAEPSLAFAAGLYFAAAYLALKAMPKLPLLHDPQRQRQFIEAWLGISTAGPWAETLDALTAREWQQGLDQSHEKRAALRGWVHAEEAAFARRLAVQEELLPLGELLLTVGLSLCLWSLPLAELFDQIFAGTP